jgi:hypothetical protein
MFLLASLGHALPAATASAGILDSIGLFEQAKWKHKHGRVKAKHGNRGDHFGWSRGRGYLPNTACRSSDFTSVAAITPWSTSAARLATMTGPSSAFSTNLP